MTKAEKTRLLKNLDKKVEVYFEFLKRDDFPDKPCVAKNVVILQNNIFSIADILYHSNFISFEECCEYWSKVGFVDEFNKNCDYLNCGANINGVCKYNEKEGEQK